MVIQPVYSDYKEYLKLASRQLPKEIYNFDTYNSICRDIIPR